MEALRQSWQSKLAQLDDQVAELEQSGAAAEAIAMRYYRQAISDCLQDLDGPAPAPAERAAPASWTEFGASLRKKE